MLVSISDIFTPNKERSLVKKYFVANELESFLWKPVNKFVLHMIKELKTNCPQIFLIPIYWHMLKLFYQFIKNNYFDAPTFFFPNSFYIWDFNLNSALGRILVEDEHYQKEFSIPHNWRNIYAGF